MTDLQPQKIANLGVYGLIRPSEVDDALIPDEAVTEAISVHFDRKGAVSVRPGYTALGSTVVSTIPCQGLHNAQAGTALAVFSTAIFSYGGSSWAVSLDDGTASVRIRFVDFGSYTIALNHIYDTYTSMRFWNAGSSRHWHYTGNPINPQNMWGYANTLGDVFKNKIYLGGDTSAEGDPSRVYFSSVISSTGNITWSPTRDFIDINPGDGEGITAIKRYSLELLFFKSNYIYRFRTSGVDPDPLIKIGTRSNESVVEGKRALYFHHESGFYRYTGAYPEVISRSISDIVDSIPFSQMDTIEGWSDDDHIYWSVGDLSVAEGQETITIKNAVLRFTESSDVWTVYSYAGDIRAGMPYTRSTTRSTLVGLDNGVVSTLNSGTTDDGYPIQYRMRTKWFELGSVVELKQIEHIIALCEKAQNTVLMYQTNENKEWKTLGTMDQLVNSFDKLSIKFNRIRFLVTGSTRYESPIFRELQIVKGKNFGISK